MTRLYLSLICCLAFGIVMSRPALADDRPELDSPSPVQVIDRENIESLPIGRDMQTVLNMHNDARAAVGSDPLVWDPVLAAGAQEHAEREARTGAYEHSPFAERNRLNFGENLTVGPRSRLTAPQALQLWLDEAEFFRPGAFPNLCEGDWTICGHYTAVVWSATVRVGCGYAVEVYIALICRYSPPGNMFGQQVFGVPQDIETPTPVVVTPAPATSTPATVPGTITGGGDDPRDEDTPSSTIIENAKVKGSVMSGAGTSDIARQRIDPSR